MHYVLLCTSMTLVSLAVRCYEMLSRSGTFILQHKMADEVTKTTLNSKPILKTKKFCSNYYCLVKKNHDWTKLKISQPPNKNILKKYVIPSTYLTSDNQACTMLVFGQILQFVWYVPVIYLFCRITFICWCSIFFQYILFHYINLFEWHIHLIFIYFFLIGIR